MIRAAVLPICLFASLVSQPLSANEINFIPRASAGIMDYSLKIPSLPVAQNINFPKTEFAVNFKFAEVGGTLTWGSYYLSIAGLLSSDESDSLSEPAFGYEERFTGDRQDFSAALGMRATDNISLYLGYKYGVSQADGTLRSDLEFKESGFFVGGNYSWPISDKGVLAFNLAVARLDGDLSIEAPSFSVPGAGGGFLLDAVSQTTGVSYGVSWHSSITEQLSYSVAMDANLYKFEDVHDAKQGKIDGSFDERMYILRLGLTYRF
jgi:hypothetical protein